MAAIFAVRAGDRLLDMSTRPDLWTVVLNYNGLEDTRKCLASLRAAADPRLATVVVDNASTHDPTTVLRAEFPWADYVRNKVNGGYAGGNNVGIRHALQRSANYVVLLNNDTVVAPDFARRLVKAGRAHSAYGILGPVINFMEEPAVVMTDGVLFNRVGEPGFFHRQRVSRTDQEIPAVTEVDIVNGCCMMVAARVFRRIGLIDERFFLVHEESDLCLRARRAGFRCGVLGETLVWHKGSSTFQQSGKRLQRYYDARNLWLLLRKHHWTRFSSRGAWRSRLEYVKYLYYRYTVENEQGHAEAAEAVLEGLCDAARGRYGAYAPGPRPALATFHCLFNLWYNRRARQAKRKGALAGAVSVC
jgi:GT2 family glycosyltransferase